MHGPLLCPLPADRPQSRIAAPPPLRLRDVRRAASLLCPGLRDSEAIFRQEVLLSVPSAGVTDRGLARNAALQMLSHGSAVPPGWQPRPPSAEGAGRALQAPPQQRGPQKSTPMSS